MRGARFSARDCHRQLGLDNVVVDDAKFYASDATADDLRTQQQDFLIMMRMIETTKLLSAKFDIKKSTDILSRVTFHLTRLHTCWHQAKKLLSAIERLVTARRQVGGPREATVATKKGGGDGRSRGRPGGRSEGRGCAQSPSRRSRLHRAASSSPPSSSLEGSKVARDDVGVSCPSSLIVC